MGTCCARVPCGVRHKEKRHFVWHNTSSNRLPCSQALELPGNSLRRRPLQVRPSGNIQGPANMTGKCELVPRPWAAAG